MPLRRHRLFHPVYTPHDLMLPVMLSVQSRTSLLAWTTAIVCRVRPRPSTCRTWWFWTPKARCCAAPISGILTAGQGDERVTQLGPGELIGAGIGLKNQNSPFNAAFAEDTHYMCWPVADIQDFLCNNPELASKFSDVVNRYLVAQINKLGQYLGSNPRVIPV